ncbi:glycosyltransferase family 2 protein [Microterricola viridarii]|uniref:N-acetylglucosaminyl-diphospho-decaprenol L-rhamnosyltransferase n=1 Tax=Microterricola viridarii TaxID=412690 RepID=A0A109QWE4_9MICO|nr:glycosyltransferase family 2 protein [Microterricola viridarii]AMB57827.1 hypothetical protein AWU67_01930 [Microterricola viridarii]
MSPSALGSTAVVTVTYNSSRHLAPFLDSLVASEAEKLFVVIADNMSKDLDTTRAIAAQHGATVIELGENRGYGGAINAAVKTLPAHIDAVLISNPDVAVHEQAITRLHSALVADDRVGATGPTVLNSDGTVYPSARTLPSLRYGVGHALFSKVWPSNPWTRRYWADNDMSSTRDVGWLSGSCLLVRRSAFEQLGGFDEEYFMYFEDVDLGYRLGKAGWLNRFVPDAAVTHTGAHSTNTESARMLRAHHDSAYRYLQKKYSGPWLAPVRLLLRTGLTLRSWYVGRSSR